MTPAGERLRTLRRIRGRRSSAETAYHLYLALLLVPLVGYPVTRGVVLALAAPPVVTALQAEAAVGVVGLALGLTLAGLAWLGTTFGPVGVESALVRLLADTDMPRHRTLVRPFVASALAVMMPMTALAVLVAGVLVTAGAATPVGAVRFVASVAVLALVASVVWLAGQAVEPRAAGALGAGIAAMAIVGLLVPASRIALPWAWVAATWPPMPTPDGGTTALLLLTGALAVASVRPLLDLLRGTRLVDEATRRRSMRTAVISGDVAQALGGLRARPSVGRHWGAVRALPEPWRALLRDAVGAARTPVRLMVGVTGLAAAAALLALSTTLHAGWPLASAGAALAHLALGVVSDGFRHASEAATAPALYGYSVRGLFARHAVAPLALVVIAAGAVLAGLASLGLHVAPLPVACVLLLAVAVRAYDSAKGPLPLLLLTPVPSPLGDLSSVSVSIWEADALIITTVAGAAAVAMAGASPVGLLAAAGALAGVLILALRRRLTRL